MVEQQRLIREMPLKHPASFIEGDFDDAHYYEAVKGLEREPEGGARCRVCCATPAGRRRRELSLPMPITLRPRSRSAR